MSTPRAKLGSAIVLLLSAVVVSVVAGCRESDPTASDGNNQPVSETIASDPSAIFALFDSPHAPRSVVGRAALRLEVLGSIEVHSGVIAVSDAFINDAPLRIPDIPLGTYVVQGLVAAADGDERVAAARVVLSRGAPTRWEDHGAFPVDSGTASFFDAALGKAISADNAEAFGDSLLKALQVTERPTWSVASLSWLGSDLVAVSSGFGDGAYPVFIGKASSGEVTTVLIDFVILPWQ